MTGISQVSSQNFDALPRAVNNRKYRPPGSDRGSIRADPRGFRRPSTKQPEIQPFAASLPEVTKGEVDLSFYLTERSEPTQKVAVDAQTDKYAFRTSRLKF